MGRGGMSAGRGLALMAMAAFVLAPVACALGPALRGLEVGAAMLGVALAATLAVSAAALLARLVRAGLRGASGRPVPIEGAACILPAAAGVGGVAGHSGRVPRDAVPHLLATTAAGAALLLTGRARRGKASP